MTIYLEYVFLENLIMDFIIIKETLEMSKLKINNKRLILSSVASSLYIVLMLMFKIEQFNYAITKLLSVMLVMYIAANPKTLNIYLKSVVIFFLVSAINLGVYIGVHNFLNITNEYGLERPLIYIFTYYISKTFLLKLWKLYRSEITKDTLNYKVELIFGNRKYIYNGFLDTGNTVFSHGMPIIFAELVDEEQKKILDNMEFFCVKTVTLGNACTKKAYVLDEINITIGKNKMNVKAGVVFEERKISRLNNYNMVLNYILYTESMGGIKI